MRYLSEGIKDWEKYRRSRQVYFAPGTYTFTVPGGVYSILGVVIGGGGAGSNGSGGYGTGGCGGGYAQGEIAVTPGQTITVTVGAGGAGGTTATGSAGATSSLGTYLSSTGGNGGISSTTDSTTVGQGSTSGVTNAYTSKGGTGTYAYAGDTRSMTGGGSSGTPFGDGGCAFRSHDYSATGGGGWSRTPCSAINLVGGSHVTGGSGCQTIGAYASASTQFDSLSPGGGCGRLAFGGKGTTGRQYEKGVDGETLAISLNAANNGNASYPTWWFPWEADGGGGAGCLLGHSAAATALQRFGGNGGFGSGGGGALGYSFAMGGDGGFGGGGGAAANIVNGLSTSIGGSGGAGGGGGAAQGRSGSGGDGCVLIYW